MLKEVFKKKRNKVTSEEKSKNLENEENEKYNLKMFEPLEEEDVLFPAYLDHSKARNPMKSFSTMESLKRKKVKITSCKKCLFYIKFGLESRLYIYFKQTLLMVVSILYALENPTMDPESFIKKLVFQVDIVIWLFFMLDLILHLFTLLVKRHQRIYWLFMHIFDASVLLTSVLYLMGET